MSVVDRIRAARRAHEALRAESPSAANLQSKADVYRRIKALFDELWAAADRADVAGGATEMHRAIRLLTIDAEHHAGLSDSEGFRDTAEAWDQYDLLERAFA
jgi:hypothetical protein